MWITFKRSAKNWARYVPGYFLEINPTWYRYGLGFYDAAPLYHYIQRTAAQVLGARR